MKRYTKHILIAMTAVSCLTVFNSCKGDLLDTVPTDRYSGQNVWTSPTLAKAAVTGVYNTLYTQFSQGGAACQPFDVFSSVMDIDMNWRGSSPLITGSMTPSNGNVASRYKFFYTYIYRANDVINNIGKVEGLDDAEKSRLTSECKFFRAYGYTYLNAMWKGVPIYTENVSTTEATKPRSTEKEVWDQVIADLTDVINDPNIPDKIAAGSSDYGRVTRGAALCYRGQAYQFLGEWEKALADFERVGTLGYALYSPSNGAKGNKDFFNLFKPANEQCDEMIFSVQCVETNGQGNPRGINYGNRCTGGSAWNNYLPNPAFVERYENADGSKFDWNQYCPGWSSMTPKQRVVFFLRDGLVNAENGTYGTTAATAFKKERYDNMATYGADMTKYLDKGNEARIRRAYENRDPRLEQSIITPYAKYTGYESGVGVQTWTLRWPYILDAGAPYDVRTDTNSKVYYLWRKYVPEADECTTRWVYSEDIILWRYADVLLRRAECLNELGRTSEAIPFVNMVRKRCGHVLLNDPDYPATTVKGQADLRERIRNEFYVELGGEDAMYFNELRWGTWYDLKFRDHSSGQTGELNSNGLMQVWGETTYKNQSVGDQLKNGWPIPAKEMEMNANLKQTEGWNN